jgi:hypothetical protein
MWLRIKGNYEKYFLINKTPFAIVGEPEIMPQRLIAKMGTFAVPGKIDEPLDEILSDYPKAGETIVKFVLHTESIRDEAMLDLYNSNISYVTLFPDINGIARSFSV